MLPATYWNAAVFAGASGRPETTGNSTHWKLIKGLFGEVIYIWLPPWCPELRGWFLKFHLLLLRQIGAPASCYDADWWIMPSVHLHLNAFSFFFCPSQLRSLRMQDRSEGSAVCQPPRPCPGLTPWSQRKDTHRQTHTQRHTHTHRADSETHFYNNVGMLHLLRRHWCVTVDGNKNNVGM